MSRSIIILLLAARVASADPDPAPAPPPTPTPRPMAYQHPMGEWMPLLVAVAVSGVALAADVGAFGIADLVDAHHSRNYGVAELAINVPLTALIADLAWHDDTTWPLVGLAAADGALAVHGIWTTARPGVSSREVLAGAAAGTVLTALVVSYAVARHRRADAITPTVTGLGLGRGLGLGLGLSGAF